MLEVDRIVAALGCAALCAASAGLAADAGAPTWVAAGAAAGLAGAVLGAVAGLRRGPSSTVEPEAPATAALPPGAGRGVLERLPTGLLLIDRAGRVTFQNPAAQELLERDARGLKHHAALRAPKLVAAVADALSDAVATDADLRLLRGGDRWVHAAVRPLAPADDPAAPRVVVVLDDRTEVAKAEALRRDFVANASHELKTPLASITGFIETLQTHGRDDPEAAEQFLTIMAQQAERMRRLVEDLLSLNRIEINEHVRPTEIVDLAVIVGETSSALDPVVRAAGAELVLETPPEGLLVRGSRDELSQLLVNLVDNAVRYAGEDGPIRIQTAEGGPERPGMLGLRVVDVGPGIAREHLPRLTERFYRADVTRSRERGGTGLGLAIAKHIVNRHRGDLSVSSVVGQGAAFTVWLPQATDRRVADPPAGAQARAQPTLRSAGGERSGDAA